MYPWPGNVRELENCIDRAVALTNYGTLRTADLPERVVAHRPEALPTGLVEDETVLTLDEVEERYIRRVYEKTGRNKSLTSRLLGIDRRTLYRKIDKYDLGS